MDLLQRIEQYFLDSIAARQRLLTEAAPLIADAAQQIVQTFIAGGKLLICSSEHASKEAQSFMSKMLGCFEQERPGLPAIALTTDVSVSSIEADYNERHRIFARQIYALARPGDILVVLYSGGNLESILSGIHAAHDCGLRIIVLTGHNGEDVASILVQEDTHISVPSESMSRIQETQTTLIHALCDAIDFMLLGGKQ